MGSPVADPAAMSLFSGDYAAGWLTGLVDNIKELHSGSGEGGLRDALHGNTQFFQHGQEIIVGFALTFLAALKPTVHGFVFHVDTSQLFLAAHCGLFQTFHNLPRGEK